MSARTAVLRFDASPRIGGGHAMRCLVLADALTDNAWRCILATNQEAPEAVPALLESGHEMMILEPRDGEAAARALGETLDGPAGLLVVDHYDLDIRFESASRKWADRIMAIDDLANRKHDCDFLLDQSAGREAEHYQDLIPEGAICLAGPSYALLRSQFRRARGRLLDNRGSERALHRLLVNFGAADGKNMTPVALKAVKLAKLDVGIDVVLGAAAAHRIDVPALEAGMESRIIIHRGIDDMAGLMEHADLCIGAAGISALERCCIGLPSIVVVTADNQAGQADALAGAGAIMTAGFTPLKDPQILATLLIRLAQDGEARARMADRAFRLCDGLGTYRAMLALEPERDQRSRLVSLREADHRDSELMFQWQTIPGMRDHFDNPEPPKRAEHEDWFEQRIEAIDGGLYVIECDGHPAGVLRLDPGNSAGAKNPVTADGRTVSILVAPCHSGAGIATAALRCARRLHADEEFFARIHLDNTSSQRAFLRAGFQPTTPGFYRSAPIHTKPYIGGGIACSIIATSNRN